MIRHLFKMVWNRKRKNALIIVEILCSFVALFGVALTVLHFMDNARRPLGFEWRDTWCIAMNYDAPGPGEQANIWDTIDRIMLTAKAFPEVKAVAASDATPYTDNMFSMISGSAGDLVTDSYQDIFQVKLSQGRWFSREDDACSWLPVVINEQLAREFSPDGSPLGKRISPPEDKIDLRVVGVMPDFRRRGEYAAPENFAFFRLSPLKDRQFTPRYLLLRTQAGTGAGFEENLAARLQDVARNISFDIRSMESVRDEFLKNFLLPLLIAGLVVAFLLIMAGLGLTGVQWQNITQRTKELGLRRASGATAGRIVLQVLGEVFLVSSIGIGIGFVVVLQLPILDLLGYFSPAVYTGSMLLSALLIYMLTIAAALYPGYLAAKVQPAEALRYE